MPDNETDLPAALLADLLSAEVPREAVQGMIGTQRWSFGRWQTVVITLSAPERHNVLDLDGWRRVARVFEEVSQDVSVRVVLIRGAGDRAFSAGADISEFPAQRLGAEAAHSYNASLSAALTAIETAAVPVIAMVDGLAVGGGCELSAACDVRLASDRSRFGIPVGKLGVALGLTETRAVARAIGVANLKYLLFSGAVVDATEALGMGLVQRVVPREALPMVSAELAMSVMTSAEATMRAAKEVTALAMSDPFATDTDPLMRRLEQEVYGGADLREGVSAFLAGRPARFTAERSVDRGRA